MSDQTAVVAEKAVKVKKEKVVKEPVEPRFSKKWTAETWAAHVATMTQPSVPEGYLNMAVIVKQAVAAGIKKSRICSAMGGDRAEKPWEPIFQVVYVGGRKYGSPAILDEGFMKLLDPEYHKTVRPGRVAKPKAEGEEGKGKVKIKKVANADAAWVAKE